jgi:hypothetical protein
MAERCFNVSGLLQRLVPEEEEVGTVGTTFRADETTSRPDERAVHPRNVVQLRIFPEGRNFR